MHFNQTHKYYIIILLEIKSIPTKYYTYFITIHRETRKKCPNHEPNPIRLQLYFYDTELLCRFTAINRYENTLEIKSCVQYP